MLVIFAIALLLSMPWLNSVAFMPYWLFWGRYSFQLLRQWH